MAITGRLTLAQKFMALGLIALLMTLTPTALYLHSTMASVHAATREATGATPVMALQNLIRLIQQHRGLAAGALGGNAALAAKLPETQDALNRALDTVEISVTSAEASTRLKSAWHERKDRWLALKQDVAGGRIQSAESTRKHTALIASLMQLNGQLMDEFGLSVDPIIENHALIDAVLRAAPMLAEKLGQLRAQGTGFLAQGSVPPDSRAKLVALRVGADEVFVDLTGNLTKSLVANEQLKAELSTQADVLKAQINRTLTMADQGLINAAELKMPAKDYFDEFTRTINSIYEFNGVAFKQLSAVLEARSTQLSRTGYLVAGLLLPTLIGASVFSILLVRHIVRQLGAEPEVAATVARSVADGNLGVHIDLKQGDRDSLMAQLSEMQAKLLRVVSDIQLNSESVATASAEIAQGNSDLSARTEQQASALEETAASMEQLNSTVRQNAENARQASQLAAGARSVAVKGGEVVGQVVDTMHGINDSSKKIADITGVIDGIAFQTNILALNAAVEAARAGEQGRGFAVVAGEVRSLAQRSAAAAKEIKSLITASVERVEQGSQLADHAGATMTEIVSAIQHVTDIIDQISTASDEQSAGVAQVGEAITQMDQTTQQNAALVEQSAAAAESLKQQAKQLVGSISVFRLK
ncbi:methyl-accepting chemotaxis protein [Aquabacterium sp.]|uniref:methyl-accepting chemotaxis protein n=1 Tax=Aquabacterium sp. TaxID=1872578 RepID=UPI00403767BC